MNENNNNLPEYVRVRDHYGKISMMPYRKLKEHQLYIMEDNMAYGLMHPGSYTRQDVAEYEKEARATWKALKNKLRENPNLVLDSRTETYIPYEKD